MAEPTEDAEQGRSKESAEVGKAMDSLAQGVRPFDISHLTSHFHE